METNKTNQLPLIDIHQVIKNKNPKLYKRLPNFVIHYIQRVIHQKDVNQAITEFGHTEGVEFARRAYQYVDVDVKVQGVENVPKDGRYVFASNHPLGGVDGVIFIDKAAENFGDVKILANDLLMNLKPLQTVFVGVDKHGTSSRDSVKLFDETFRSDTQILVFPAGLISRKIKGRITDLEWKKTFLSKAIKYQRDIVPVHISGRVSNFFYNLSNIRKKLGIKANLEMFYLVDEAFKQRGKTITITFGKPIPYTLFDKSRSQPDWAQDIKRHVYTLPDNIHNEYIPFNEE